MRVSRLTLVGCCAEKLGRIAPARQLYRSPLFQKAATYAQSLGVEWQVISAAYGLIKSDSQLAPYDVSMSSLTPEQRKAWAKNVAAQLEALALFLEVDRLEITLLAGESYAGFVPMVSDWCAVYQPMRGMQIGQRLQWLNAQMVQPELFAEAA
jgi:hypothetical protein